MGNSSSSTNSDNTDQKQTKVTISPPPILKSDGSLSTNWYQWKQSFQTYLQVLHLDGTNDERVCSLFLHSIGQYGMDIFNRLDISKPYNLQQIYSKFDLYCNSANIIMLNRHEFFTTKQEANQTFESFLAMLFNISTECQFGELRDNLLLVQFISGVNNHRLKERLLKKPLLTISDAIAECRIQQDNLNLYKKQKIDEHKTTNVFTSSKPSTPFNCQDKGNSRNYYSAIKKPEYDPLGLNSTFKDNRNSFQEQKQQHIDHRRRNVDTISLNLQLNDSGYPNVGIQTMHTPFAEPTLSHSQQSLPKYSNPNSSHSQPNVPKFIYNCKFCGGSHIQRNVANSIILL